MEYIHVITDANTGKVTSRPFTAKEIKEHEAMVAKLEAQQVDPVEKLKSFLAANPDVANLLNGAN